MIVVADASPVQYLIRIDQIEVLKPLYGRVLLPQTVANELQTPKTPEPVRNWMVQPPQWCEILPDLPWDLSLAYLDAGERAAITLAMALAPALVLMDDGRGRAEAKRRKINVRGTLGVLIEGHRQGLLDFEESVARLVQTNIYLTPDLIERARRLLR